eukprot:6379914-Amphidinium_carterae.1
MLLKEFTRGTYVVTEENRRETWGVPRPRPLAISWRNSHNLCSFASLAPKLTQQHPPPLLPLPGLPQVWLRMARPS